MWSLACAARASWLSSRATRSRVWTRSFAENSPYPWWKGTPCRSFHVKVLGVGALSPFFSQHGVVAALWIGPGKVSIAGISWAWLTVEDISVGSFPSRSMDTATTSRFTTGSIIIAGSGVSVGAAVGTAVAGAPRSPPVPGFGAAVGSCGHSCWSGGRLRRVCGVLASASSRRDKCDAHSDK